MATLMEKDVLLELTTGAMAILSRQEPSDNLNNNNYQLQSFYSALITNPPEIFDFHNMANKINGITAQYEHR